MHSLVSCIALAVLTVLLLGAGGGTGNSPEQKPKSNDTMDLKAVTEFDGPKLTFDFPALQVGVAEYEEGPTGCTVFYFPGKAEAVADVRGGMHATIYSDYLENGRSDKIDAICLAGGSIYGLEAATGVTAELLAKDGYSHAIRKTTGAICYDLFRDNMVYPDKALGRAALQAARPGVFPLGAHGAGRHTGCGAGGSGTTGEPTGQGGAFRQVGPTKIAVFTVVNALGAIVDRNGNVVRGNYDPQTGKRYHWRELVERRLAPGETEEGRPGHTTLTVLVTNQKVGSLEQLARQVHTSMARAIQPFHTTQDGDILYAVSTEEVDNEKLNTVDLGVIASELAWDAVLSCFPHE